jgi:GrpB-like predicted nucleotidyltransferase (UPF0157 family)
MQRRAMTEPEPRPAPLGLHKSAVVLCPHNCSWAGLGESERSTIEGLVTRFAADVQHVGSTAVTGLDAKPILDIAVALDPAQDPNTAEIARRMQAGGYQYRGDRGPDGGLFFVRAIGDVHTVHVHMVSVDDPEWARYITFRDYLRATPERRRDYQRLKQELATRYASDRVGYTEAKTAFISETLRLAAEHAASAAARGTTERNK